MKDILTELEAVILQRQSQNDLRSYTCRLLSEGSRAERKVNEEAYELIEAAFKGTRQEMINESCDLIFHFLVLLRKYKISLEEIANELRKRRK